MTLPTTPTGTAQVLPGRGVKIHYVYYWSDVFHDPAVERKQVPVRYDPFDAGTAFAFVRGQWVQCHSEFYPILHSHSEREMMLATQELRSRHRHSAQQRSLSAKAIGDFLQSVEAQEVLLTQRLRDHQFGVVPPDLKQESPEDSVAPQPFLVTEPVSLESAVPPDEYETYGEF